MRLALALVVVLAAIVPAHAALITFIEAGDLFTSNIGSPVVVDPAPLPLVTTPPFFLTSNGPGAHAASLDLPFSTLSVSESGAWWFPEADQPLSAGINVVRFFGPGSPIGTSPGPHILFTSDVTDPLAIAAVKLSHNFLPDGKLIDILGDGVAHQVLVSDGSRPVPEGAVASLLALSAAALATWRARR